MLKIGRTAIQRKLPLLDKDGRSFSYALPDDALRGIELVDKQASGRIGAPAPVLPEAPTRERYVINSLIEEAITSSQLEGAATTRKVAKEMLRTGRKPRTRDERMIVNNYMGMLRVRYARSFLHSEQDEGDLTYFVLYQLRIAKRAINDLHEYLDRKVAETQQVRQALRAVAHRFNVRQLALLENAIRHPGARYTVASHGRSHGVVAQTARGDLQDLEEQGFLAKSTSGRGYAWTPAEDLERRLRTDSSSRVGRQTG